MSPLAWATTPARKLVDAFLLQEREKIASVRTDLQQANAARYRAAAVRRVRGAREITHSDPLAALALYREAAVFLIVAFVQGTRTDEVDFPPSAAEAWRELDRCLVLPAGKSTPDGWALARETLASEDPLAADAMSAEETIGALAAAAEAVDWLASAVESRTAAEIRVTRRTRLVGAALAVAFVLCVVLGAAFSRKNIAHGMPAMASSQRPGSPPASGVDNGEVEHTFGVHTNIEQDPWVRIDLGASVPIHEVRVYNRGDGYESEILPLALQLSDDGSNYETVAERTEVFTRDEPWVAKLDKKRGRYVRIYMPKQGYIALAEVEVY